MPGDRAYRYDAGKCLIASMEMPIRAQITCATPDRPYPAFSLALDPAMISDLLLEREGAEAAPAGAALVVHALWSELADPLCRLLALCRRQLPGFGANSPPPLLGLQDRIPQSLGVRWRAMRSRPSCPL